MGASITLEYSSPMSPTVPAGLDTTRHASTLSWVALFFEIVTTCDITPAVISHVVIKRNADMHPDSGRKGLVRASAASPIGQRVLHDRQPGERLTFGALGRQIHLRGLVGHRAPVEIRGQPFPRGLCPALSGRRIVEYSDDCLGQSSHIPRWTGHSGLAVD